MEITILCQGTIFGKYCPSYAFTAVWRSFLLLPMYKTVFIYLAVLSSATISFNELSAQVYQSNRDAATQAYAEADYGNALGFYEKAMRSDSFNHIDYYNAACTASLLGRADLATAYLETSVESGYYNLYHLERDKDFDGIRTTPGFVDIQNRIADSLSFVDTVAVSFAFPKGRGSMDSLRQLFAAQPVTILAGSAPSSFGGNQYYEAWHRVMDRLRDSLNNRTFQTIVEDDFEDPFEADNYLRKTEGLAIVFGSMITMGSSSNQGGIHFGNAFDVHFIHDQEYIGSLYSNEVVSSDIHKLPSHSPGFHRRMEDEILHTLLRVLAP